MKVGIYVLKVVETFSGIGSQCKALKKINANFEIVNTCEWDINSIIAYCLIHDGKIDTSKYSSLSNQELYDKLKKFTLSTDGKSPIKKSVLKNMDVEKKRIIYAAIQQSNNLVSITDVTHKDIPNDIDIFTYSFPCQDLSVAAGWHGNDAGIKRERNSRSGLLWQVERILLEKNNHKEKMPKFLVMENVANLLSKKHEKDFQEWKDCLKKLGYFSKIYKLKATDFGIPQTRTRVFMVSVNCEHNGDLYKNIKSYYDNFDLYGRNIVNDNYSLRAISKDKTLKDILKIDYTNDEYKNEAQVSNPNNTISREKIFNNNKKLFINNQIMDQENVCTITTKQDRHPNSGVIEYKTKDDKKSNFRFLTGRECFELMGFDEKDYQNIRDYNMKVFKTTESLNNNKAVKMAGNSIVVNVLEAIFQQIIYIDNHFFNSNNNNNNN